MAYPKTDKDLQAESDFHALMQSAEIQADPKRLKAAEDCAKRKLQEMEKAGLVGRRRVMAPTRKKAGNSDYAMSR